MPNDPSLSLDLVLSRLNPIGEALSRLQGDDPQTVHQALELVASTTAELLPVSGVSILAYDRPRGDFSVEDGVSWGGFSESGLSPHQLGCARQVVAGLETVRTQEPS